MQEKLQSISGKISNELDSLEELLIVNREALIHEHLERLHDTRVSAASAPSSPTEEAIPTHSSPAIPIHWRSRATMRRTPHLTRRSIDSCGSTVFIEVDSLENRSTADSTTTSCKRMSASAVYCDKVSRGVTPIMNPIDKALGKISNFVHGPASSQRTSMQQPQPVPSRPPQQTQGGKKTTPELRKALARGCWEYIACGACANSEMLPPIPPSPHAAVVEMEKKLEEDMQASLAKFKREVAESERAAVERAAVERAAAHDRILSSTSSYVPPSSLQTNKVSGTREVSETVVELSSIGQRVTINQHQTTSLEETRRALFKSLGSSPSKSQPYAPYTLLSLPAETQPPSAPTRINTEPTGKTGLPGNLSNQSPLSLDSEPEPLLPVSVFLAGMVAMEKTAQSATDEHNFVVLPTSAFNECGNLAASSMECASAPYTRVSHAACARANTIVIV